ncbi:MAG: hypothetical protein PHS64_01280 [Candidatus Omnitrophica bacterium]|nr:hypothetical protein [Candidatus Omnitrophota bacterium]
MKRIMSGLVFTYLFIFFLVYAGVFRNNNDPVKVSRFYFECMRNYEWMLTYPVTKPGYFDDRKLVGDKERIFDKERIDRIDVALVKSDEGIAFVRADLICLNERVIKSAVRLERSGNKWQITEVRYQ